MPTAVGGDVYLFIHFVVTLWLKVSHFLDEKTIAWQRYASLYPDCKRCSVSFACRRVCRNSAANQNHKALAKGCDKGTGDEGRMCENALYGIFSLEDRFEKRLKNSITMQ